MTCTLDWQAPTGYETYVEFGPCTLNSPSECNDKAVVTQSNSAEQEYCGTGAAGIYTWLDSLDMTVTTDQTGQEVGCAGFILAAAREEINIG